MTPSSDTPFAIEGINQKGLTRREALKRLGLGAGMALAGGTAEAAQRALKGTARRPNVLFIFPDQLRRYSAGYWTRDPWSRHVTGQPDPVITPNIDRLAEDGLVFTQAVANHPLCSPYRGMLLTGAYPARNGITNNCRTGREDSLNTDITNLPEAFRDAGYTTAYFGKCHWIKPEPHFDSDNNYVGTTDPPGGHLPNRFDTYVPPGPDRIGIEYFYHLLRDDHFDPITYSNDPRLVDGKADGEAHEPREYNVKLEAEALIDYLGNTRGQRDPEKPFFAIWSLNPPHNPWVDEHTDMDMYRRYYDTDSFPDRSDLLVRDNVDPEAAGHARHYFAAVSSVDHYVGKVVETLKALGELDNTLLVFTSDHGEMLGSHGLVSKNVPYLESAGVPFIVHWPDKIKPRVEDDLMLGAPDIMPTLMGLAGLGKQIPESVQGTNYEHRFRDPTAFLPLESGSALYLHIHARGLLSKRHTLVLWEDPSSGSLVETYIFDNLNDPYQMNKLPLDRDPGTTAVLLRTLADKLRQSDDPWYRERRHSNLIPYGSGVGSDTRPD